LVCPGRISHGKISAKDLPSTFVSDLFLGTAIVLGSPILEKTHKVMGNSDNEIQ
jgi:hypothetical protein